MIQQIFTTFPNIYELDIENCNLQSISIPPSANLIWLDLYQNNISRIDSGVFRNQTDLLFFFAVSNNIQEIDEAAFDELGELLILVLVDNNIEAIAPRTFQALTELIILDFEDNSLTRIDDQVFSTLSNIGYLYLEFNQINAIHPRFAENLRNSLSFINLTGNQCVSSGFEVISDVGWAAMNNGLNRCFNNFNGTGSDTRRVTLEFVGNLSLFDEFGNLIARV